VHKGGRGEGKARHDSSFFISRSAFLSLLHRVRTFRRSGRGKRHPRKKGEEGEKKEK